MMFERYDTYKDSGVEWLGEIPSDWEVKRIKDLSILRSGENITSEDFNNDGIYPVYGGGGFRGYANSFTHDGNHILIGRQGALCGNIKYANGKFWASEHSVVVYVKNNLDYKWYGHVLEVMNLNQYSMSSAQPGLSVEKLTRLSLPFISKPNQTKIVIYLDQKTATIDKEINLLEKKIKRYKELKQTLINETVLRGLDKSVKLKDSGIEWIGKIPEHWEVKRLKDIGFIYSGLSGKSGDDFKQEDSLNNRPYIPFTNIAKNRYIDINDFKNVLISKNETQNNVKQGDLFFLMSSEGYEDIGKTSLLINIVNEVYLNSFCKGFRINEKSVKNKFINYLMSASTFRDIMILGGKGFTRINLKIEKINDFSILKPPYDEQEKIATYLDQKTQKIDTITKTIKDKIDLLKEFRKTLINDAVTGKIKVTS